ncbi:MAG: NAD(P)-binding domain-containing protein [Candidatus Methylacidiphilales bacterium]
MMNLFSRYTQWLHTRWPAGTVEKLPEVGSHGATRIPGIRIVGDLSGIPLLKFSSDTGARAVHAILAEPDFQSNRSANVNAEEVDIAIIGAGVAGVSAAIECSRAGLSYRLYESAQAFSTVANFPKGKPIYTYPKEMTPAGGIQYAPEDDVKEKLLTSMRRQMEEHSITTTNAHVERIERRDGKIRLHLAGGKTETSRRAIIAIGRSGNFRTLNVPGEELDKVSNRLHDPKEYHGKNVLIVGGGDSALEAAIALTVCGAHVTLCYRKPEFSRPKPDNLEKIHALTTHPDADLGVEHPSSERITTAASAWMRENRPAGSLTLALHATPVRITETSVEIKDLQRGELRTLPNDAVFTMIGREAPLDFFRRSGLALTGDRTAGFWASLAAILVLFTIIYQWKKGGTWLPIAELFKSQLWFPFNIGALWNSWGGMFSDPSTLLGTLSYVVGDPGFYYSVLYTVLIGLFGWRRIQRRRTPYVTRQTITLFVVQFIPLFLLPYILLPWAGFNGWFDAGIGKAVADELFPVVSYGSGREYWRAFGLVLAWPLFIWNVFTQQPLWWWLGISLVQTFVIIPLIIYRWGKGAYCGWICSCGAMAETLGDTHRHKMPHGPFWNRFNMTGQVFLAFAFLLLGLRLLGWMLPDSALPDLFKLGLYGSASGKVMPWSYAWFVDLLWAGIIGFGLYFHFSGRMWCRFACPLAAWMHICARFSRFRIFPEKSKCISCNVCTSVCHQGIDIMNFANKGIPMEDPECVRCSACVQQCPTGVLSFGRYAADGKIVLDSLPASPVRMRESS